MVTIATMRPACGIVPHCRIVRIVTASASILLSEGRDLQDVRRQLGHESSKLTADTYGAWLSSTSTNANDCLDDPDWQDTSHRAG
jgi:hypothetical protein